MLTQAPSLILKWWKVKRGGGWVLNQFSSGNNGASSKLASFTWSPIDDQAKLIYFAAPVVDEDYLNTGQMAMVLVQFDLSEIMGYQINDARLVVQDSWNGSDNEFALEIVRIPSGPEWEPFPDPDPAWGHDWSNGRSVFESESGYRFDIPPFDLLNNTYCQEILDSNLLSDWGLVIQGACWAARNENGDPWDPMTPEGEIGMIHQMRTWNNPEGTMLDVGGTQSVSSSLKDLVQGWVSGRYQNNGLVFHPSTTLVPADLGGVNTANVHGGWHSYNVGNIWLAVDAVQS
ncbi:MAG: hypothetical protein ACOX5R_22075 [bacterium]